MPRISALGYGQLHEVKLGPGGAELRVSDGVVGLGVEIRAAREADARDLVEQGVDRVRRERWHHHGYATGKFDRAHVAQAECHLMARRLALLHHTVFLGAAHF